MILKTVVELLACWQGRFRHHQNGPSLFRYGVFGHIPIVTCPNFSRIIVSPCGIRVISVFVFMLL